MTGASSLLVVAPHPDDETLGPGGTLLRRADEGWRLHWLIVTSSDDYPGFDAADRERRQREIELVEKLYDFETVTALGFPTSALDTIAESTLHDAIDEVMRRTQPHDVLLPFHGDSHSDHRIVFRIGWSCCKTFRAPFVRRVFMYDTPSETDYAVYGAPFRANYLVDISGYLDKKIEVMSTYQSEMRPHPFPRSAENLRARAIHYGAAAGCDAAEGFMLVQSVERKAPA